MNLWQAVSIPTDTSQLTDALGITEKRADELIEIAQDIVKKDTVISDILEEATGHCKNINETVWISFIIGAKMENCKSCAAQMDIESLLKMLTDRFGGTIVEIKTKKKKND